MAKNDYRTANYMSFAAPLKGAMTPPPPEAVAAIREFVFLHALKGGTTTIIDVGGLRGDWDGYARLVDDLGVRVYGSPTFRDRNTFMDAQGRLYYDHDAAAGEAAFKEALEFVKKFDGSAGGRLRGMLNAAQVETCTESLLRAGKDAARTLNIPIHTHAGGNLIEFERIMAEYRKTPIQFLADIGFLDERTLLGHAVFTTAHPWPRYQFGDDLRVLAQTGATVGHCPYKYAKMAMTLQSFQRYLEAGVNIAIGTDTFPMDMVAELRWASILAKIADANYQAGLARDVFNAATLGGCKFLGRDRSGPPRARRQGRPPPHQPRSSGRGHLRRSHQVAGGRRLRPGRGHGDGQWQDPGAGGPRQSRGRGRGVCEGAPGDPALLGACAPLALGQGGRGSDHSTGLPAPSRRAVGAPVAPRATPPRMRMMAAMRDTVGVSPSQSVAVTTLTTGVMRSPSAVVTAGRLRLAIATAQYASAEPGMPA